MIRGACLQKGFYQWRYKMRMNPLLHTFMITWMSLDSNEHLCHDSCQSLILWLLEFMPLHWDKKIAHLLLVTIVLISFQGLSLAYRFYFLGIYYEPNCNSSNRTHTMLLVGYGFLGRESDGRKYWLVKNR